MWLFCCYSFERSYKVLKWKTSCILLNRKINFALIKTNRNQNWEIPYTELERWKLCFRSYKNRQLKFVRSWIPPKKKEGIFCTGYFSRRNIFWHFCFVPMYGVLNALPEFTYFTHQKTLLPAPFCLFLNSSKAFNVSFSWMFLDALKWNF